MNFFERQEHAKKQSSLLLFYYFLAVLGTVAAVNGILFFGVLWFDASQNVTLLSLNSHFQSYARQHIWLALCTLGIVSMGSFFRWLQMRHGGRHVAEIIGGRELKPHTREPRERILLNIVEEMALASGMAVPSVYVLDQETGINAFAAGLSSHDAAIAVTRGALTNFDRSELQAVIGHEFSHLLNGDSRLNVKLIAVLAGLLTVSEVGYMMMRVGGKSSSSSRRNGALAFLGILGLGVFVIGWIGYFFANLIKSGISRQREYLADASAVQFTRNPLALKSALEKIRDHSDGSIVMHTRSMELSHMYFAEGFSSRWIRLFSTHPPIDTRIRLLSGGSVTKSNSKLESSQKILSQSDELKAKSSSPSKNERSGILARVGDPRNEHLLYAAALCASIPTHAQVLLHSSLGAKSLIYHLLTCKMDLYQEIQNEFIAKKSEGRQILDAINIFSKSGLKVDPGNRLSLLELCIPALNQMSLFHRKNFFDDLSEFVLLDKNYTLFEFSCLTILRSDLRIMATANHFSTKAHSAHLSLVLSLCARAGSRDVNQVQMAYKKGADILAISDAMVAHEACTPRLFDAALIQINSQPFKNKKLILQACLECIRADGVMRPQEAELFRAISAAIDCPMPPLVLTPESESSEN